MCLFHLRNGASPRVKSAVYAMEPPPGDSGRRGVSEKTPQEVAMPSCACR